MLFENEFISARRFAQTHPRLGDFVCILLLISASLAIGLPRYRAGIDWSDEGFLAYGAVRVMEGQIPNRDFVSLQPPLSFYVAAAVFKFFGTSLGSLRILGLSLHVLVPLLIYAIARNLMSCVFSAAAALPATILVMPYFGFVPFAVWQGITVTLVALLLYLRAIMRNRVWLAVPAGAITTLSIFLRHDQGVYFVLSILILMISMRCARDALIPAATLKRVFVLWMAGAAMIAMGFTIFWWKTNALPEMFRQLIVFPLTVYGKTSSLPFPHFDSHLPLSQNATTLLFWLPPLAVGLASIWIVNQIRRRRFCRSEAFLTFLAAWSALFYCQVLTRSDLVHLLYTLPPFFILAAYDGSILLAQLRHMRMAKISASIIAAATAICFFYIISPIVLPDLSKDNEVLDLARSGGVRVEDARFLSDFVRGIQQYVPPERSVLCLPYIPTLYFLCERRNPTRWNYLWPGDQTLQDHERLIHQAQSDPPAVIFINNEDWMASFAPLIEDYVHRQYRPGGNIFLIKIYFPRSTTP